MSVEPLMDAVIGWFAFNMLIVLYTLFVAKEIGEPFFQPVEANNWFERIWYGWVHFVMWTVFFPAAVAFRWMDDSVDILVEMRIDEAEVVELVVEEESV